MLRVFLCYFTMNMDSQLLNTKIEFLKGVGPQRAELLKKELNIFTFGDLLQHFPFRYIDKSKIYQIAEITSTAAYIQLQGKITSIQVVGQKRGKRMVATFQDETGTIELVWFKGIKWLQNSIKKNVQYVVYGKPTLYRNKLNITHPELDEVEQSLIANQVTLEAVYSTTEKLTANGLHSKGIYKLQKNLVAQIQNEITETLPPYLVERLKLLNKESALINVHIPQNAEQLQKAIFRLKFEELFFLQLSLLRQKVIKTTTIKGQVFNSVGNYFNTFYQEQ